jgi:hypothetical protein
MKLERVKATQVLGTYNWQNWPYALEKESTVLVIDNNWAFLPMWVGIYYHTSKLQRSHLETLIHLNCDGSKKKLNWEPVLDSHEGKCRGCSIAPPKDVSTLVFLLANNKE